MKFTSNRAFSIRISYIYILQLIKTVYKFLPFQLRYIPVRLVIAIWLCELQQYEIYELNAKDEIWQKKRKEIIANRN